MILMPLCQNSGKQKQNTSLGNHEFDNGVKGLTPFIQTLKCPVLAANLVLDKEPELEQQVNLKKSVVIIVDGVKVGIIGYLTPDTKTMAKPNNVEYINEIDAIIEEVAKLQDEDVKIIVALGHSGYTTDLKIAKEVNGIDLVIGGHTNTFLWNGTSPDSENPKAPYPTYVKQQSGKMVPVVQAYAYTKYLGKLHIIFNHHGEIVNLDGEPILLDMYVPQDPEVMKIVHHYRQDALNVSEDVVGNTSVILDGHSCKRVECNLGNMITDAMVNHYVLHYKGNHWTDASIAIIQGGGLRSSIVHAKLPAAITKGDLLTVMPFEGMLATVTVNGSVLLEMLERSVANYDSIDDPGEFLQYSGIKVVYNMKKPIGSRVVAATARCWACEIPTYHPIVEEDVYKVIMPSFVAGGGDGYKMFVGLPTNSLHFNELIATQHYIHHHGLVYPEIEGRITVLKEDLLKDAATKFQPSFYLALVAFVAYLEL